MKRVYLVDDELEEEYLQFDGDLLAYERAVDHFILPSYNLPLLKHMTQLALYLDDLTDYVFATLPEEQPEGEPCDGPETIDWFNIVVDEPATEAVAENVPLMQLDIHFGQLCEQLWEWHEDVKERQEIMTGDYAVAYFLSWASFARIFHLTVCQNEAKYRLYTETEASQFAYAQLVAPTHHILVADGTITAYSVRRLWLSARMVTATLYVYSYSSEMKQYVHALFFRYCDLVTMQQSDADRVFDNPLFIDYNQNNLLPGQQSTEAEEAEDEEKELFDAFKRLKITVTDRHSLDNSFLYEGELLFYPQLFRLRLSEKLERNFLALQRTGHLMQLRFSSLTERTSFLQAVIDGWAQMMSLLSKDLQLRTYVIGHFKSQLASMYVFHGEAERYKRQFPDSSAEASDILSDARPNDVLRLNKASATVLTDLIAGYAAALKKSLSRQTGEATLHCPTLLTNEREAVLLTSVISELWFQYKKVPRSAQISGAFLLEELCTLSSLDRLLFHGRGDHDGAPRKLPLLIKLIRIYYIVDVTEACSPHVFFRSEVMPEAFLVWLTLCVRYGHVAQKALHSSISKVVCNLNRLLS